MTRNAYFLKPRRLVAPGCHSERQRPMFTDLASREPSPDNDVVQRVRGSKCEGLVKNQSLRIFMATFNSGEELPFNLEDTGFDPAVLTRGKLSLQWDFPGVRD